VFDSARAIEEYIRASASAVEQWLVGRTQLSMAQRTEYQARAKRASRKQGRYSGNSSGLRKKVAKVEAQLLELEKKVSLMAGKNRALQSNLAPSETENAAQRAEEAELKERASNLLDEVQTLTRKQLALQERLHTKEQLMHMERDRIGQLQIELGELKVTMESMTQS
jgi:chromosome segregation ATPase